MLKLQHADGAVMLAVTIMLPLIFAKEQLHDAQIFLYADLLPLHVIHRLCQLFADGIAERAAVLIQRFFKLYQL